MYANLNDVARLFRQVVTRFRTTIPDMPVADKLLGGSLDPRFRQCRFERSHGYTHADNTGKFESDVTARGGTLRLPSDDWLEQVCLD